MKRTSETRVTITLTDNDLHQSTMLFLPLFRAAMHILPYQRITAERLRAVSQVVLRLDYLHGSFPKLIRLAYSRHSGSALMRSMSISYNTYYNTLDGDKGSMFAGKNVFTNVGTEKIRRRPSQVDRAVHRLYDEPRQVFNNRLADQVFKRTYWVLRSIQYRIFYKNEELDTEEVLENWELGVKPPPLEEMARTSQFNREWLKYMYAKFKNECPSGRMKEPEFRSLLDSILPKKQNDAYISRLFRAFSNEDQKTLTFQNLIECLSHLHPETAETRARWTVRLITGNGATYFTYPEFLAFTKSVFALSDSQRCENFTNRESPSQRAEAVFRELDSNGDGLVSQEDMVRFFTERRYLLEESESGCSSCYRTPVKTMYTNGK